MKIRSASPVLFALGVGLAAAGPARAAPPAPGAFVRDFYAAYGPHGAARIGDFYAADATFTDPSFELDLQGRDQIRDLLVQVLAKYESLDWAIAHTAPAGDDLTVEGTMVGRLHGQTVRVPFVSVFHFKDGKIAAQRDLFDVLHFYAQLGVVPAPFRPKPAPAPAPPKGG